MAQSFAGPPFDLDDLIPELAALGRRTTLLLPKSGFRSRIVLLAAPCSGRLTSLWPSCGQPGHWAWPNEKSPAGTIPMVPVMQLFARDVPELQFPEGMDVLQLVWCPLIHPQDQAGAALPKLYWRSETDVLATGVLRDIPAPQEGEFEEEFMPSPCTVSPTSVREVPELGPAAEASTDLATPYRRARRALRNGIHRVGVCAAEQGRGVSSLEPVARLASLPAWPPHGAPAQRHS